MTTTEYASTGAVNQHDSNLPVRTCSTCGAEIVFCSSKRTGRRYPVSVSRGYHGQRFYVGANLHRCQPVVVRSAWADATIEQKMAATILAITCGAG